MPEILHVEDDVDLRNITGMVLTGLPGADQWDLEQVGSAAEAKESMAAWHGPALLVSDKRLPDGDGVALAAQARELGCPVRAVILTAMSGMVCPSHVDEVIEKPWGLDELEATLGGITARWMATWPLATVAETRH